MAPGLLQHSPFTCFSCSCSLCSPNCTDTQYTQHTEAVCWTNGKSDYPLTCLKTLQWFLIILRMRIKQLRLTYTAFYHLAFPFSHFLSVLTPPYSIYTHSEHLHFPQSALPPLAVFLPSLDSSLESLFLLTIPTFAWLILLSSKMLN